MNGGDDFWHEMPRHEGQFPGWRVRRLFPDSRLNIFAAIRLEDGVEALLLEVGSSALRGNFAALDCVGFVVGVETVTPGPGGVTRICLSLRDQVYRQIFASLCADVASRCVKTADDRDAVQIFMLRIQTWLRFLQRHGRNMLSERQQAGLFAELVVLRDELMALKPTNLAISAWRGPEAAPKDFITLTWAIEVKSSLDEPFSSIRISSLEQLEADDDAPLLLCCIGLKSDSSDGVTLPELIEDIRVHRIADDAAVSDRFETLLMAAGYLDIHAEAYSVRRLTIAFMRWFRVEAGFPRLTNGTIPEGVLSASYQIAFGACLKHEVQPDSARQVIMGEQR